MQCMQIAQLTEDDQNRLYCETRKKQIWVKSQLISEGKLEDNYNLEIRDYQLSIEFQDK